MVWFAKSNSRYETILHYVEQCPIDVITYESYLWKNNIDGPFIILLILYNRRSLRILSKCNKIATPSDWLQLIQGPNQTIFCQWIKKGIKICSSRALQS